jgi:hypothetical protein
MNEYKCVQMQMQMQEKVQWYQRRRLILTESYGEKNNYAGTDGSGIEIV